MPYITDPKLTRQIRRGRGPRRTSVMSMMGIGGLGTLDPIKCSRIAPSADGTMNECIDAAGNVIESEPISGGSSSSGGGFWDMLGKVLSQPGVIGTAPTPIYVQPQTGMSTTTMLVLGGAAILAVVMLTRD